MLHHTFAHLTSLAEAVTDPSRRTMVLVMLLRRWASTQVEKSTTVGLQGKDAASHIAAPSIFTEGHFRRMDYNISNLLMVTLLLGDIVS